MLGKMFKHEFKATARHFLLMYAVFAFVTVCNKIVLEITANNDFWAMFQGLFMGAYILTCAIIFVMTTVLIVMRFYKNMTSDEGYLSFTLPVTVHDHLISKSVVAFVWYVASFIVFAFSILILTWGHVEFEEFAYEFGELFGTIFLSDTGSFILLCVLYALNIIISSFYTIFLIYMAIAMGQLVNKHRVLTSIGAYFGINFVIQNITSILFLALTFFVSATGIFDDAFYELMDSPDFFYIFMNGTLGIGLVLNLVLTAVFYFVTNHILTKKLNLE